MEPHSELISPGGALGESGYSPRRTFICSKEQ